MSSVDGLIVASRTTAVYDRASRPIVESLEGTETAAVTERAYTALGDVALTTLPDGTHRRSVVRFDGAVTKTELVPDVEDPSDPGAPVLSTEGATLDVLGRETAADDGDADSADDTVTTYDRLGRVLTTGPIGAVTAYSYDRAGNQITATDPAGVVTTTTYDPLNRATVVVANDVASPSGPADDVTTTTYYDPAGNVVAARDPREITSRTIVNVRDMVSEQIANCTDTGTLTPSTDPAACTGGTATLTANVRTDLLVRRPGQPDEVRVRRRPRRAVPDEDRDGVRCRRPGPGNARPARHDHPQRVQRRGPAHRHLHELHDVGHDRAHDLPGLGGVHGRRRERRHVQPPDPARL